MAYADLPSPPPPAPAYAAPSPDYSGPEYAVGVPTTVYIVAKDGSGMLIATGPAEAAFAAQPMGDEAAYQLRLCLQLQDVKPHIDWGCVSDAG